MIKFLKPIILLLCITTLCSCGSRRYHQTRQIKIEAEPGIDFYLQNQGAWRIKYADFKKLDPERDIPRSKKNYSYLGSTDSTGRATFELATDDYKTSKKRLIGVRSGYEPQEFKLKMAFSPGYLLDIFFPPALFFDKPRALSAKRTNKLQMRKESKLSAVDYIAMAETAKKEKDAVKYYHLAITQDQRNEQGLKARALSEIGLIHTANEELHKAFIYFTLADSLGNNIGIQDNLAWLDILSNRAISESRIKKANKQRKLDKMDRIANTMTEIGTAINTVAGQMEQVSGTSSYGSSSSIHSSSGEADYRQRYQQLENIVKRQVDSSTSSSMNSGNFTTRQKVVRDCQRDMKQLRSEALRKGIVISPSHYETVNLRLR